MKVLFIILQNSISRNVNAKNRILICIYTRFRTHNITPPASGTANLGIAGKRMIHQNYRSCAKFSAKKLETDLYILDFAGTIREICYAYLL